MKILYLDINVFYHNPTRNNISFLLKEISELYIYGLGYTSEEVLKKGLTCFFDTHGPFDFIITNEHIIFGSQNLNKDYNINGYKTNFFTQFNLNQIKKILNEQYNFFKTYSGNKIICLLETDYYSIKNHNIETLYNNDDSYILGCGNDVVSHTSRLEYLKFEIFGQNANNNWYDFVQNNINKIIEFPHFVNSSEFYFECLHNRKNIIYVAGINYYHRKKVIDVLKNTNYKINKKYYNKIYSLMRKLKLKPDSNPILIRLYNILFRNELERSKYIFTCGSGLEMPIRKFFEIPASGSILLASPFYNSNKLGFIDGVNYIKTDYLDIVDKINWLESNQELAQEISKNGQDLIWKVHSLSARAKQLLISLHNINENCFSGSYWDNGEFKLK